MSNPTTSEQVWKQITDLANTLEEGICDLQGDTRFIGIINAALSAESEKWQMVWTARYETLAQANQQLREQLAAAVESLKEISRNAIPSDDRHAADCADAALSRISDS